jgi:hypothetical protein
LRSRSHQLHAGPKEIFLLLHDRFPGKTERSNRMLSRKEWSKLLLEEGCGGEKGMKLNGGSK